MGLLLIPLLIGILLSPCLDERFVWAVIPITIVLFILTVSPLVAPRVRGWCLWLLVALIGAADASRVPAIPPIPEDAAVRAGGKLLKAPEGRGLGAYLDVAMR